MRVRARRARLASVLPTGAGRGTEYHVAQRVAYRFAWLVVYAVCVRACVCVFGLGPRCHVPYLGRPYFTLGWRYMLFVGLGVDPTLQRPKVYAVRGARSRGCS